MTSPRVPFSVATAVEQLDTHSYRVNLDDSYCIGSVPNGGYTASCVLAVASQHLSPRGQPDTLTAHIDYIARVSAAPAIVVVEDIKLGRQLSTLHLTLWQDGLLPHAPWVDRSASRRVVLAYATQTDLRTFTGLSFKTGYQASPAAVLPPRPDLEALKRDSQGDALWFEPKTPKTLAFARSLKNWHFYLLRDGPVVPGAVDIWVRTASGEPITQAVLPYLVDSFPYNIVTLLTAPEIRKRLQAPREGLKETLGDEARSKMWFPTVVMNLEVKKRLPEEGVEWMALRATSKLIQDGRLDLEIQALNANGDLVALGHQVALMLSLERNLAKRGTSGKSAL